MVHLVQNGAFKEQWAIHVVGKSFFPSRHFADLFLGQRFPEVVSVEIVGVGVVVIVGNFPAVVWEEEWHHADGSKEFVHHSVFGEGLMGAIMADNKQSSGSSTKQDPSEWQEVPRGLEHQVEANNGCCPHSEEGEDGKRDIKLISISRESISNYFSKIGRDFNILWDDLGSSRHVLVLLDTAENHSEDKR